jgi:hypothetical protein
MDTQVDIKVLVPLLSGVTGALVTLIGNHFYSRWKGKKEKRETIFRTLMSTRGYRVGLAHVESLCAVEVEWSGKNDARVRSAWKAYNHHLNNPENVAWRNEMDELFGDLIVALGDSIGKPQDKTEIKRGTYGPRAWADAEYEMNLLRKGILSIIQQGQGLSIPISVASDQAGQSKSAKAGE